MQGLLQYHAARISIGVQNPTEVKKAIDTLMAQGVYLDDFYDAIGWTHPRIDEVLRGLRAALDYFGIGIPRAADAVRIIVEYHVRRIASGSIDAVEGLQELVDAVDCSRSLSSQAARLMRECQDGIKDLQALYWCIEDVECYAISQSFDAGDSTGAQPDVATQWNALRNDIRKAAQRWLEER